MSSTTKSVRKLRSRLHPVNYASDFDFKSKTLKKSAKSEIGGTTIKATSTSGEKKEFQCPECDRSYRIRQSLHAHRTTVHNVNARYVCDTCGKVMRSSSMLAAHCRRHTGERPFRCDLCNRAFISAQTLLTHQRTLHALVVANERRVDVNRRSVVDVVSKHCCTTCDRCFSSRCHLTRHERSHTKERPYQCDHCPKAFARRENLKAHIGFVHEGGESYECDICGRGFASDAQRRRHRLTHDNSRRFQCQLCGKRFRLETSLTNHTLLVHIRQTDHQCTLCKKCFLSRTDLDRHWTSHRIGRQHWCDLCDKSFTRKCSLDKHVASIHLRNTGYVCEHCGRCVDSPSQLETHRRVHTGERPFHCPKCDKCYKRNAHLTQHITTAHR